MSNDPTGPRARTVVRAADSAQDPRVTGLRDAVARLRRELAGYRAHLSDREVAENELAALDVCAAAGVPVIERLRGSLLVLSGAVGSVSALAASLADVRAAIDLFGPVPTVRSRERACDPG